MYFNIISTKCEIGVCVHVHINYICVCGIYENKIVKITNLLVTTATRNSGNCNLIGRVGYHDWMVIYMYLY